MNLEDMLSAILNCKEVDKVFVHNNAMDGKPELNIQFKDYIEDVEFDNYGIKCIDSCAIWE